MTTHHLKLSSVKKILAIKLRALGDTVLITAPLTEIKRALPRAEIHVAVTSCWAPLLENHPAIHKIWKYERFEHRASRAKSVMRLALRLRRERFDCVLNFHASPSSATISFATGASIRSVHFHGHRDRNRHSTVVIPGKGVVKPVIERDMDTVRALGIEVPAGRLPSIHLLEREKRAGLERLRSFNDLRPGPGPFLVIGLGASRPSKNWSIQGFAELAVRWVLSQKGFVLAVVGPDEKAELSSFKDAVDLELGGRFPTMADRARARSQIAATCELSLRELASTLTLASVFVGNDSGPKHIAVAVGCPSVTIFGPEDPFEWHPYPISQHPYLYRPDLACRKDAQPGMPPWCGVHDCLPSSPEKHRCMTEISDHSILAECLRVMRPAGSAFS